MGDNDYINDCLTNNPVWAEDVGNIKGSLVETNGSLWGVTPVYTGFNEGETMEEVIKRVVKEAIGQITGEGALVVPKIEKYHIKHK
jgi:hypothetical protein